MIILKKQNWENITDFSGFSESKIAQKLLGK